MFITSTERIAIAHVLLLGAVITLDFAPCSLAAEAHGHHTKQERIATRAVSIDRHDHKQNSSITATSAHNESVVTKRAIFLGDSNMYRVTHILSHALSTRPHKVAGSCDLPFVHLRHNFKMPQRVQGQGPCKPKKPGCTDCTGCISVRMKLRLDNEVWDVLFMPLEFANDTARRTGKYSSSQEIIVNQVFQRFPPDKVLLSLGTHDTCALSCYGIPSGPQCVEGRSHATLLYERGLSWLASLLKPYDHMFFAAYPPCREQQPQPFQDITTRDLIYDLNQVARQVFRERFVDTFSLVEDLGACNETHADGVHLQGWVYREHIVPLILRMVFGVFKQ